MNKYKKNPEKSLKEGTLNINMKSEFSLENRCS
jgi:hypothetical protein